MRTRSGMWAMVCAVMLVGAQWALGAADKPAADAAAAQNAGGDEKMLKLAGLTEPKKGDLSRPVKGDEKGDWDKIEKMGQTRIARPKKGESSADYTKRMADHVAGLMKAADEFQKNYPLSSHVEEALKMLAGSAYSLIGRKDQPGLNKEHVAAAEKVMDELAARKDLPADADQILSVYQIGRAQKNANHADKAKTLDSIQKQLAIVKEHLKKYPKDTEFGAAYLLVAEFAEGAGETETATDVLKELAGNSTGDLKEAAETRLKALAKRGTAFELNFTALDGRKVDLTALKGKVVLIDFWATWCGPCMQEFPHVKKVYDKYHDKGLEIVGISLDENKAALESFIEKNKVAWPQYFDGKGWENALAKRFEIHSIPAMWLIDKDGKIATLNARENLEVKIQALLSAAAKEEPKAEKKEAAKEEKETGKPADQKPEPQPEQKAEPK